MHKIFFGDNLEILKTIPDKSVKLCFLDPPYNTQKSRQTRKIIKAVKSDTGLVGFGGNKYDREDLGDYASFDDKFDDYIGFLKPRLLEMHRILTDDASAYIILDYREVHYVKVLMDEIFGRENFINEIVWCYNYGANSKKKWSAKHDNILFYAKDHKHYTFNYDKIPRIPYEAPTLAGPEKAARGKIVVDWWKETIVPTNSREKQNYATQKPLRILNRIVEVSSNPNDLCMDFFAGSGSFGEACLSLNRDCILIDNNPEAIKIMQRRLFKYSAQTSYNVLPNI